MHHVIGASILIALIAFAFGERVARAVVGAGLILAALAFAYVVFRIVEGTI